MAKLYSTIIEFDLIGHSFKDIAVDSLQFDHDNKDKVYWIHCDLNQAGELAKFEDKLKLPEHIMEWCQSKEKQPIFIEDELSLTIEVECLLDTVLNEQQKADSESLIIYLTSRYCFTASSQSIPALLVFLKNYTKALPYAKTSCFILYLILDNIINDYTKLLHDFQLQSDQIDLKVREMQDKIYSEVINIKKQVMKSKRYISSIRDTLMRISSRKIFVVSKSCRLSLRNLFTHSQMIFVQFDSVRDSLKSTLDQIDNVLMQKMNNTMKVLTAFAAVFLPMSLIAGIYGMNFSMPEFAWKYGYLWPLSLMIFFGGLLIWLFRKKEWF